MSRHKYVGWESGLREGCQTINPIHNNTGKTSHEGELTTWSMVMHLLHTDTSCGTEQGSACVFPFYYKVQNYFVENNAIGYFAISRAANMTAVREHIL